LRASVRLPSGDTYDQVRIVATDQRRDIAIIQIAGFGLPVLELGNSDSVQSGAQIVSIGSPLGLENTVSTGVISGRRILEGFNVLQITAPVSSGSSGGPVLDVNGLVIGIAAATISEGQNLNFAIPINYARGLMASAGQPELAMLEPFESPESLEPVNRFLSVDLRRFEEYDLEVEYRRGARRVGTEFVRYRIVRPFGDTVARIEVQRELDWRTDPKGLYQSRDIATADNLQPIESHFSVSLEDGRTGRYKVAFEPGQVRGSYWNSEEGERPISRRLPAGILQSHMLLVAVGWLDADSLMGRSFAFTTYDPLRDQVIEHQFTVTRRVEAKVGGDEFLALEVEGLMGAERWVYRVRERVPHIMLEADGPEYTLRVKNMTRH
jgi:hypothetical protein